MFTQLTAEGQGGGVLVVLRVVILRDPPPRRTRDRLTLSSLLVAFGHELDLCVSRDEEALAALLDIEPARQWYPLAPDERPTSADALLQAVQVGLVVHGWRAERRGERRAPDLEQGVVRRVEQVRRDGLIFARCYHSRRARSYSRCCCCCCCWTGITGHVLVSGCEGGGARRRVARHERADRPRIRAMSCSFDDCGERRRYCTVLYDTDRADAAETETVCKWNVMEEGETPTEPCPAVEPGSRWRDLKPATCDGGPRGESHNCESYRTRRANDLTT